MSQIFAANSAVGIFRSNDNAVLAAQELKRGNLDIKKLSVIGRDYHSDEQLAGYYNTGGRMKYWGKQDSAWARLWDLLTGAGYFLIPGIGPLIVAGPVVASLVDAIETSAVRGGPSIVMASLYDLGVPTERLMRYEVAIKMGKLILIYNGSPEEVENAKRAFSGAKSLETATYLAESPVNA